MEASRWPNVRGEVEQQLKVISPGFPFRLSPSDLPTWPLILNTELNPIKSSVSVEFLEPTQNWILKIPGLRMGGAGVWLTWVECQAPLQRSCAIIQLCDEASDEVTYRLEFQDPGPLLSGSAHV
jgi:hypothetical protein